MADYFYIITKMCTEYVDFLHMDINKMINDTIQERSKLNHCQMKYWTIEKSARSDVTLNLKFMNKTLALIPDEAWGELNGKYFDGCVETFSESNLTIINIPDAYMHMFSNVISMDGMCSKCESLVYINLNIVSEKLYTMKKFACGNKKLSEVSMTIKSNHLNNLNEAFAGCRNLKVCKITFNNYDDNLADIHKILFGVRTFSNNTKLTILEVNVGNNIIISCDANAMFRGLYNLKHIRLNCDEEQIEIIDNWNGSSGCPKLFYNHFWTQRNNYIYEITLLFSPVKYASVQSHDYGWMSYGYKLHLVHNMSGIFTKGVLQHSKSLII